MKFFRILLVALFVSFTGASYAQEMIIGTYNIRFDNKRDSGNLWVDRAPIVTALLRFHDFDIFGTQEALKNQLDDISNALPEYSRYGLGRDDGREKGEHAAIFYKKATFRLLDKGDFWLSQSPEKPSLGWDATCCNRICSWVYLQDIKNGKKFYVFNAHYDHQGVEARKESSKLVLAKISSIAGSSPVIFMGDLNGGHDSDWYLELANSKLLKDSYAQVKYPYVNNSSFNGFGSVKTGKEIIDHVFVTTHFRVAKWGLLTDTYNGKFPSDHFPVYVKVKLK
ncbi:endonuclease/exonuclease/phosphatase family protein [Flavihumibacter stibioxidans]|uniref:Endonuclease n=1 Tax=Flavihumibacter stibioxidans TaxID=1834163 RepID=A0ABR7M6A6_9BACT|nr:endonuclease/exonuclease/phosphatase family protein [Flavihumibacter stibioxidans]MBC6490364.1 endonuclease [Flavihumibacter stibioxidans]